MDFDIESFYPSIAERLFRNGIQIAEEITETCDYDMSLINESRKTLFLIKRCAVLKKMVVSILIGYQRDALMGQMCMS